MTEKMRWLSNVPNCCGRKYYPKPEDRYQCCSLAIQRWIDDLRERGYQVELRAIDDWYLFALWSNILARTKKGA